MTETADSQMPPQNLIAEQASLGACLVNAGAAEIALAFLKPDDYYREAHRIIFDAIGETYRDGNPVDMVTVATVLRRKGHLESVGGAEYLTSLIESVPTAAHIRSYCADVARCSMSRQAIQMAARLQASAYENPDDPAEMVGSTIRALDDLQEQYVGSDQPRLTADRSTAEWQAIERKRSRGYVVSPQRFGIRELDERIGGLEDAGFLVIMGDTNMGKSSLLRQIMMASADAMERDAGNVVVLFGMEEASWRWRLRSLGWLGHFDTSVFDNATAYSRHEQAMPNFQDVLDACLLEYDQLPLMVADGDQSMGSIEAACKRIKRERNIRLVGLDYLQLVGKAEEEFGTEERAFRDMAKRIMRLRDALGCPVIGASQVTRQMDGSFTTFGARAFGHFADTVVQIHRKRSETGDWQNEASIESVKTRELRSWGQYPVWTDFKTGRWCSMVARSQQETAERMGGAKRLQRDAIDREDPFDDGNLRLA